MHLYRQLCGFATFALIGLAACDQPRDIYLGGTIPTDGGPRADAGQTADAGMTSDCVPDCGTNEVCRNRTCEPATPAECLSPTACANDGDCPGGTRCNTALTPPQCYVLYCGKDQSPCSDPLQCSSGMTCIQNHCQGPGKEGEDCESAWPCSSGLACVSSKCRRPGQEGDACAQDRPCASGLACDTDSKCKGRPASSGFATSVSGTYLGRTFGQAYAWRVNSFIVISNRADFCTTFVAPDSMTLQFYDSSSAVIEAETLAFATSLDTQCEGGSEYVESGAHRTIWIDGDTRYGSFHIPLPNNESLHGTFKTLPGPCNPPMESACW